MDGYFFEISEKTRGKIVTADGVYGLNDTENGSIALRGLTSPGKVG